MTKGVILGAFLFSMSMNGQHTAKADVPDLHEISEGSFADFKPLNLKWDDLLVMPEAREPEAILQDWLIENGFADIDAYEDSLGLPEVMADSIRFFRAFNGEADLRPGAEFRAQFTNFLSEKFRRLAWVAVVDRSIYNLDTYATAKATSVGIGIKGVIAGKVDRELKPGEFQISASLRPLTFNYESLKIGSFVWDRPKLPESGLKYRPTGEIDARAQIGDFQPGARVTFQPKMFNGDPQLRMMTETYIEFRAYNSASRIREVNIVPRCQLDVNLPRPIYDQQYAYDHFGIKVPNGFYRCMISAEIEFFGE